MAPVGAWTAATGRMDLIPWILFLIIFLWTPPHFWALALFYKDDYIKSKLPMMPVIKGDDITLRQILIYSIVLVLSSLILVVTGSGWIYLIAALYLGYLFIKKSIIANKTREEKDYKRLFGYSIIYLFALFFALVLDSFAAGVLF
jgi:protoheme IX farnesyltransferase